MYLCWERITIIRPKKKIKKKKEREYFGEKQMGQKKHCYIDYRNISYESNYVAVRMEFPQRN